MSLSRSDRRAIERGFKETADAWRATPKKPKSTKSTPVARPAPRDPNKFYPVTPEDGWGNCPRCGGGTEVANNQVLRCAKTSTCGWFTWL